MSDVQCNLEKLKALLEYARKHSTIDAWAEVAVGYAEGCNAEIKRLQALCENLVGEEKLHQDGLYETAMTRLRAENAKLKAEKKHLQEEIRIYVGVNRAQQREIDAESRSLPVLGVVSDDGIVVWHDKEQE